MPANILKHLTFSTFIASHLIVALVAPMFMAVMLPISAALTLLAGFTKADVIKWIKTPLVIGIILFSIYMFVTVPYSFYPPHSLIEALQFSIAMICFALLWNFKSKIDHKMPVKTQYLLYGLFSALVVILAGLNYAVMQKWLPWQAHPLNRAAVIYALCYWPFMLMVPDIKKPIYHISLFLLLWASIATGISETALVMHIFGALTFCFYKFIPMTKKIAAGLFFTGIVILSIVPSILSYIYIIDTNSNFAAIFGAKLRHLQMWALSANEAVDHMPFGTGINVIQYFSGIPSKVSYGDHIPHPHNYIIELMLDFGIFGAVIIGMIFYGLVSIFMRAPKQIQPQVAATLITLVTLYTLAFTIWQEWRTGFVAFAMALISRSLLEYSRASKN